MGFLIYSRNSFYMNSSCLSLNRYCTRTACICTAWIVRKPNRTWLSKSIIQLVSRFLETFGWIVLELFSKKGNFCTQGFGNAKFSWIILTGNLSRRGRVVTKTWQVKKGNQLTNYQGACIMYVKQNGDCSTLWLLISHVKWHGIFLVIILFWGTSALQCN